MGGDPASRGRLLNVGQHVRHPSNVDIDRKHESEQLGCLLEQRYGCQPQHDQQLDDRHVGDGIDDRDDGRQHDRQYG
jgi:hypothetical protein